MPLPLTAANTSTSRPALTRESVHAGQDVRRKPGGRGCRVVQVSEGRDKVQIRDGHTTFWAKMETVLSKWY